MHVVRLVSESGLEGHTTGSQGRSHARDEACEERLCEKHSPSNLRQARLAKCLKQCLYFWISVLSRACLTISSCQVEIADPFEGPANVLFGVVDDDDEEEGVINKVIT